MIVAVIPARAGSKRIPNKNIRDFAGKPMLAHVLEAARASGLFDRIIVSTDSDAIAEIAVRHGGEAPFRRPAELSGDHTGTQAVVAQAIRWLGDHGTDPEFVCCIYATAPLMDADLLAEGYRRLRDAPEKAYAISVATFPYPVQRALIADGKGGLAMLWPDLMATRSQDLAEVFHDAGQFYWGRPGAFLEDVPVFGAGTIPIFVPRYRVQDIDTEEDWARAELIHALIAKERERGAS